MYIPIAVCFFFFFLKVGASGVCMQIDMQVEGTEAVCLDEPRSAETGHNKDTGHN